MAEASPSDNEPWFDLVGASDDGEWVTIRPHGSDTDVNVPTRTGFDAIDNLPERPQDT